MRADGPTLDWDVACEYQYARPYDPIVAADGQDVMHLHDIFGARISRTSTFGSLRAADDDNCGVFRDDESGYWAPSLYRRDGVQIRPRKIKAYYRVG